MPSDFSMSCTKELMDKHEETTKLSKRISFKLIVGMKVLALVFVPLLLLNYLVSLLPFNFGDDNSSWGFLDILVAVFIVWIC